MRRRLRPKPTDTSYNSSNNDALDFVIDFDLPLKARSVLGAKSGILPVAPRIATPEPLRELLAASAGAQGSSNDTTPTATQAMHWPNLSSSNVQPTSVSSGGYNEPRRNGSGQSVRPHQFYTEQKASIDSMKGYFYDSSKQPLYVSQQTSASAVRDMALRKGTPTVQEMTGKPDNSPKPLKSAMKQPKFTKSGDGSRRPKKLDMASLFPHPKGSNEKLVSPSNYSQSASGWSGSTETMQRGQPHSHVRRQMPNARFESVESPVLVEPITVKSGPRVKIFDPDIYDETKTHKRQPPKGIKNWFDGFDISSEDEEQQQQPVELPANPPRPSVEGLPSDFSPYRQTFEEPKSIKTKGPARQPHRKPREVAVTPTPSKPRPHIKRMESETSTLNGSVSSGALGPAYKRPGASRLAHVQLDSESILALSDESEDERRSPLSSVRDSRLINEASTTVLRRPAIPPRKIHSKSSLPDEALRKSTSTGQTFGSIPIRLTDSIEIPPVPSQNTVQTPRESQALQSPRSPNPRSQHSKAKSSPRSVREKEDIQSAAGETTSSVPTDASHVMAVTEEEMMLLELMRQKRAAMQKNSFAEGYRLALKQEEEHLAKKRNSTVGLATKRKQQQQQQQEEMLQRANSAHPESGTESMFSDDRRQQRKRYSMIRKGSVDKNFKMSRFLAMQAAAGNSGEGGGFLSLAQMERFLVMKPDLLDAIQGSRPVSGTEIEAESMTEQDEDTFDEGYTVEEEDVVDENGVIIHSGGPSPMQRLTEMVRGSPPTPASPFVESPEPEIASDIGPRESILSDAKTQPTSSTISRITTPGEFPIPPEEFPIPPREFPIPPVSCMPTDETQSKRWNFLAPPIDEEEPLIPDIPARSPNRTPLNWDSRGSKSPRTPRQLLPQTVLSVPAADTGSSSSPPTASSATPEDAPMLSTLDFAPLEIPLGRTGSPSLSTSRPSPLTPTFAPVPSLDKSTMVVSGSDGSSVREQMYTSSPEPPARFNPVPSVQAKRPSKKLPPQIDTAKGAPRVTSMSSMTSASEDVLAAWAELGGGSDALATRRRGR